ncbi:MAG: amino acid ABC transporter substrate-binding protein [Deltaproteobacteria bacterium]|nr:amino acid ABC transporter substrate-binding protein [Deltaproteobacteria bacterium]
MSRNRYFMVVALAAILSTMLFTGAVTGQEEGGVLQRVLDRGTLICGVNSTVPGFGFINDAGEASGFDVDFCHAIAAGVLGDANAVQFVPLTAAERLTAVQTGAVDVLIRNTTHTLTRDTENGMDFGPVNFYDGQRMMVRVADGYTAIEELDGTAVCVLAGTTTEQNLADQFAARGLEYEPVVYDTSDATMRGFEEGRCDALTSDYSQLMGLRSAASDPSAYTVIEEWLSKEPLAPVYLQGDPQWGDVVNWITWGVMFAEELGITSANIGDFSDSVIPEIRRFVGAEGDMGAKLGLPNDFMVQVITQVGNYGEIYERNLGDIIPDRGLNQPYTTGGLLYAPGWR